MKWVSSAEATYLPDLPWYITFSLLRRGSSDAVPPSHGPPTNGALVFVRITAFTQHLPFASSFVTSSVLTKLPRVYQIVGVLSLSLSLSTPPISIVPARFFSPFPSRPCVDLPCSAGSGTFRPFHTGLRALRPPMEQTSQKSHDTYLQYVIFGSAIVAICTGLWTWSFKRMFIVYVGSILLGMLVVIPDWEYFTKRHYTEWIEPMAADEESRKLQRARFPVLRKTAKYAKREDVHIIGIIFFIVCTGFTLYFSWKFLTT